MKFGSTLDETYIEQEYIQKYVDSETGAVFISDINDLLDQHLPYQEKHKPYCYADINKFDKPNNVYSMAESRSLRVGLSESDDGIVKPATPPTTRTKNWLENNLHRLTFLYPNLVTILKSTIPEMELEPYFYMAYMHTTLGFYEYISIVKHLEGGKPIWVLSNIGSETVNDPLFQEMLLKEGVNKIEFIDLKAKSQQSITLDESYGSTVNLVRLPVTAHI